MERTQTLIAGAEWGRADAWLAIALAAIYPSAAPAEINKLLLSRAYVGLERCLAGTGAVMSEASNTILLPSDAGSSSSVASTPAPSPAVRQALERCARDVRLAGAENTVVGRHILARAAATLGDTARAGEHVSALIAAADPASDFQLVLVACRAFGAARHWDKDAAKAYAEAAKRFREADAVHVGELRVDLVLNTLRGKAGSAGVRESTLLQDSTVRGMIEIVLTQHASGKVPLARDSREQLLALLANHTDLCFADERYTDAAELAQLHLHLIRHPSAGHLQHEFVAAAAEEETPAEARSQTSRVLGVLAQCALNTGDAPGALAFAEEARGEEDSAVARFLVTRRSLGASLIAAMRADMCGAVHSSSY